MDFRRLMAQFLGATPSDLSDLSDLSDKSDCENQWQTVRRSDILS